MYSAHARAVKAPSRLYDAQRGDGGGFRKELMIEWFTFLQIRMHGRKSRRQRAVRGKKSRPPPHCSVLRPAVPGTWGPIWTTHLPCRTNKQLVLSLASPVLFPRETLLVNDIEIISANTRYVPPCPRSALSRIRWLGTVDRHTLIPIRLWIEGRNPIRNRFSSIDDPVSNLLSPKGSPSSPSGLSVATFAEMEPVKLPIHGIACCH